jgi:hypothetical protein
VHPCSASLPFQVAVFKYFSSSESYAFGGPLHQFKAGFFGLCLEISRDFTAVLPSPW